MKKFRKTCVATSLAGLSLLFSPAYAVTADDVACTACVGLTDIAGSAVNSYKIVDGSIKGEDIKDNEIKSRHIKNLSIDTADIASHAINTWKIKNGDVRTVDLADLAVTEAKLEPTLSAKINKTVNFKLFEDFGFESFTGSGTPELLRNLGTYTKISPTSTLLITYSDSLKTDNGYCSILVKVDDFTSDGSTFGLGFAAPSHTTLQTVETFFSSTGTFSGISAGTYDIDLYKRVLSVTTCGRNSGIWTPTLTVMEIEP